MEHTFQNTASHSRPGVRVPSCISCCTKCGWTADFMLPQSVTSLSNANPANPVPYPPSLQSTPLNGSLLPQEGGKGRQYAKDRHVNTCHSAVGGDANTLKHSKLHVCPASCVSGCAQGSLGTPLPVQNSCLLESPSSSSLTWLGAAGGDAVLFCLFWSMHLVSLMSLFMCW